MWKIKCFGISVFVYEDAEAMSNDMLRWTTNAKNAGMSMRSAIINPTYEEGLR